ncbi:hypothetical protein B0O99DRAFT_636851 [Bisporella sp. PMI_857]|nr:hypothetical protein B0O99DRAFT_636851 [Bisporella sp. PMI_857]
MTRSSVYGIALLAFVAATAMTFTSIFLPDWISWSVTSNTGGGTISKRIGLHRSCSTINDITTCHHFPQHEDCHSTDRYFCSMWRSVGFIMSFTAAIELATLVAYLVVIAGGRQKRETGWKIMVFLLGVVGVLQCGAMSIVAYLYDNDERFFVGWKLDNGWMLCTVSWSIIILSAVFLGLSAFIFPSEGGYELIPSERLQR